MKGTSATVRRRHEMYHYLLALSREKQKEADVVERASSQMATDPSLVSASECRIADLVQKVNPKDGHFLKYVPDVMLTDLQKATKKEALEEDRRRIASYKKSEES